MLKEAIGLLAVFQIAFGLQCIPGEILTFERVTGLVPIIALETILVRKDPGETALVNDCMKSCIEADEDCVSFVIDYHQSSCFKVNSTRSDNPTLFTPQPVDYYEKICIKGPQCGEIGAMVERVPGFELRAYRSVAVVENIFKRSGCASACLNSKVGCRSALYDAAWGKCILIGEDRRSLPSAFVPSIMAVDYLENLCLDTQSSSKPICSLEEFHGVAFIAADFTLQDLNFDQCRQQCEQEKTFLCRGFTLEGTSCSLHSADLTSAGPDAMIPREGATYYARAPCLDLLIRCSKNLITARLQTSDPFYGRLFVRGRSNDCDVTGQGDRETTLDVGNTCAQFGESGVSLSLVVQYNPILQRRGDRALNVSCGYGDSLLSAVNGSIVVDGDPFMGGAVSVNSTSLHTSTAVRVLISDREGREASITEVGKDLELRITSVNTDPFDVAPGKLVASNIEGTDSVLLLDERGCPPDPATFPALTKEPETGDLVAHFKAFRFTDSTVVRFHVRVLFCQGACPPVDCGSKGVSYGRRRRDENSGVGPKGRAIVWTEQSIINPRGSHPHDLETDILVFGPEPIVYIPINLTSTESPHHYLTTKSIVDEDVLEGWCVTKAVFLGVLIGWILLQILLAVAIWIVISLYFQHTGNVKLRNVRWKDDSAFD